MHISQWGKKFYRMNCKSVQLTIWMVVQFETNLSLKLRTASAIFEMYEDLVACRDKV